MESLGDVPAHWEVRRLHSVCAMRVSNVDKHIKEGEVPVRLCNYVDVYRNEYIRAGMRLMGATASREEVERFRLRRGDTLITKDSEAWNDIGVPALVQDIDADVVSGYHLALLRPNTEHMEGAFLFRALQTQGAKYQFHVAANGVTRYGLSHHGIKSVRIPVPTLPEQVAIARFLEHTTSRIDRYIRAKEELIALLEEQKQAIINEVVTGRIDVRTGRSYAAYKPSGLEWLGSVPAHWRLARNRHLFVQRNEVGYPELPILEVSLRSGVTVRDFERSTRKQIMSDHGMYKRAVKGDIAYNMMRMWQGAVGVAPVDGLVSPAYVVAKPMPGTEQRFFDHLYHTSAYMTEVNKCSRGIVADRNRLYWEDFKQMPTPCPPPDEQCAIADYIDREANVTIDQIRMRQEQIRLADEYRARLIADVVTGKLDVRGTAPALPRPADMPVADLAET